MLNLARKVTLLRFSASGDSFCKTIVFMMMAEKEIVVSAKKVWKDFDHTVYCSSFIPDVALY